MKNPQTPTRLAAFMLALALLLTSCGGGGNATATTMHLRKTEGTVGVSDGAGKSLTPAENLGLYSGYGVDTQSESYAWIDLDDVKLTKLDENSQVEIKKEDKHLTIEVKSGSLFFNVTEPLAEDEALDIRTSTMLVGIRGTCGWVTQDTAALLEGTVSVTAGDQTATVKAGEMAVYTDGALEVKPFTAASIPAFVKAEVGEDDLPAEETEAPAESGVPDEETAPSSESGAPASVDPIYRRDMYTYSGSVTYYPDGRLFNEMTYYPDEQGRIGGSVQQYLDRDLRYEWEYFYNDEGTLSSVELADGTLASIVTENTADHRKRVSNSGSQGTIYYYDEQGRMTRNESADGLYTVYTYEEEKLIRADHYWADGSPRFYTLYKYD